MTTDLSKLVAGMSPGQTLTLDPGNYTTSTILSPPKGSIIQGSAPGVIVSGPAAQTLWKIANPGVTLAQMQISTAGTAIECASENFCGKNLSFANGILQAFRTAPGAKTPTLNSCVVGLTRTVSVYVDEDGCSLQNITCAGVVAGAEYAVRLDVNAAGIAPAGFVLAGSHLTGQPFKDTIGIRAGSAEIDDTVIVGNIRIGQVPSQLPGLKPTPGQWAMATIRNVAFTYNNSPRAAITVDQGAKVIASDCRFSGFPLAPITVDANSLLTTDHLTMIRNAGQTFPHWASLATMTAKPARWVDGGGNQMEYQT